MEELVEKMSFFGWQIHKTKFSVFSVKQLITNNVIARPDVYSLTVH